MKRKSIEEEINDFVMVWGLKRMTELMKELAYLFQLYNVDENDDWVEKEVGSENLVEVRLIRSIYLISRLCDCFASTFVYTNANFKNLWKRLEKIGEEELKKEKIENGMD